MTIITEITKKIFFNFARRQISNILRNYVSEHLTKTRRMHLLLLEKSIGRVLHEIRRIDEFNNRTLF